MENLVEIAEYGCEVAKKEGAEFVDVGVHSGMGMSVDVERGAVKHGDTAVSSGVSVRAFIKGGMGFTGASSLKKEDVRGAALKAAALAKVAQPDPDFVSLPEPSGSYPVVEKLWDDNIRGVSAGKLVGYLRRSIEEVKSVRGDAIINGGAGLGHSESAIANSLGIRASIKGSSIRMSTSVTFKEGDDVGTYFDFDNSRLLPDFNPSGIGVNAAKMALKFLGARHIQGGVMPVVFGPLSGLSIFRVICWNANAEDIQRNRSYLIGKKGAQIASDIVTVVDDPLIPAGMGSGPFDGEGFPHSRLTVIEKGVLKTWLHNSYTANKGKEKNTGNSTRGGTSITNTVVSLGTKTEKELISEIKDGLYVAVGSIFPNPQSGDISETVDWGFKIENGEIAYPVKNVMIGMHMLEFMKNIDAISSDFRGEPGARMPSVRVRDGRVAGGK